MNAVFGFLFLGLVMARYGPGVGLLAASLAGAGGNIAAGWVHEATARGLGASGVVNPALGLPPEILGDRWAAWVNKPASPEKVLNFYFRTRKGRQRLNEAKLILVGFGQVGKTCLIKRMVYGTFKDNEPETLGIEIQPWSVTLPDGDTVRLHVWDFGGQEILHATHQFFLTERTVYLLVLNGRTGQGDRATQDAEYWLQLIRSFGGDSKVIIALNKSIQHPFDVNRGLLLEKYPFIVDFVKTDCEKDANGKIAPFSQPAFGISDLFKLIVQETAALEHRKTVFPADWFAIKERLADMTNHEEKFVTWAQYQSICRRFGERDTNAQQDLARYLHILGVALNYSDDPRLRDHHVLNPNWVTEGIYSLLRFGQKARETRQGVISSSDLAAVLSPIHYPAPSHDFLLRLMEKFQLCFELPSYPGHFLVPELLGENQPDQIKLLLEMPALGFRYQYRVLPEGLLPRFVVQTHALSEKNPNLRWRSGVVLERDGSLAVIRADSHERQVNISVGICVHPWFNCAF